MRKVSGTRSSRYPLRFSLINWSNNNLQIFPTFLGHVYLAGCSGAIFRDKDNFYIAGYRRGDILVLVCMYVAPVSVSV